MSEVSARLISTVAITRMSVQLSPTWKKESAVISAQKKKYSGTSIICWKKLRFSRRSLVRVVKSMNAVSPAGCRKHSSPLPDSDAQTARAEATSSIISAAGSCRRLHRKRLRSFQIRGISITTKRGEYSPIFLQQFPFAKTDRRAENLSHDNSTGHFLTAEIQIRIYRRGRPR